MPVSGWLSAVIGRKRYYMICVAVFTVSSVLCGLAPNLGALIFFRILQGSAAAAWRRASRRSSPTPSRRGSAAQAFALYGIAVIVAPTVGPTLGGWITDNYSWHWIFFINVPIGVALALPGAVAGGRARGAGERTPRAAGAKASSSTGSALSWSRCSSAAWKWCSTAASRTTGSSPASSSSFAVISALSLAAVHSVGAVARRSDRRTSGCCSSGSSAPPSW